MYILLSLFAGIGLIFIGSQFMTAGVRQIVGSRLRAILAKAARQRWRLIASGIGAGALIQSANAITYMAISLIGAGALTVEAGTLIVAWSYVGSAVRLFAAAIDLYAAILVGLGVVGFGYYRGWDKDPAKQHWLQAILGLALLMLGINIIVTGTAPLRHAVWLQDLLVLADRFYPVGFLVGTALAMAAQGTTVTMIVMGLARAGVLNTDQASIVVAGAMLGVGIFSYLQAANLHGEERQLSILQFILKVVAIAIIVPLLLVEHFLGIPTLSALMDAISSDVAIQLIFLYWLGSLLPAVVLSPFNAPVCRLLARLSPPSLRESLGRPQYIFPQAAADPASALDLSRLERNRIFETVPVMLEPVTEGGRPDVNVSELRAGANALLAAIDRFLAATLQSSPNHVLAGAIMTSQYVNQVLKELVETSVEYVSLVSKARSGGQDSAVFSRLTEPLHAMLSIATERMAGGAAEDVQELIALGSARDKLLTDLRAAVLDQPGSYNRQQREAFYHGTRLFERMIWLIGRIGASLASMHQDTTDAAPADAQGETQVAIR